MSTKSKSAAGEDPHLQKEKLLTKSICRLLLGFNFPDIPDAIETLKQKQAEKD